MKKYLTILIFVFLFLVCIDTIEAQKMVVPGRTWWYWSETRYNSQIGDREPVILGLTIGNESEEVNGALPCYAIDHSGQKIVDVTLAYLSEENSIVTLAPNFNLSKYSVGNPSNELIILSTFLGYWHGNSLEQIRFAFGDYNLTWNKDPERKEFILYDFSYKPGESFNWPWCGANLNLPTDYYPHVGDLQVESVEEEYIELFNGEKRKVKAINLKQDEDYNHFTHKKTSKIIEGLGIVKGELGSFVLDMITWYGFFIAPQSVSLPNYSGAFANPEIPVLYLVEESDGTLLYLDAETYEKASTPVITQDAEEAHSPIYDLHGRRISSPRPGSIYIRDGKKFVGK